MHRKLTGPSLLIMMTAFLVFNAGCAKREVANSQLAQPPAGTTQAIQDESRSMQPDVVKADPAWFACQKNADCVVVKGPCSEPQALNFRFETDFAVYRQRLEKMIDCMENARLPVTDPPQCLKNRCTLNQK